MINIFKKKPKKIGLALSGGGTKGFAHIGALKAFEELGLEFDMVCGTSAGSIVGAFYASKMSIDEIYQRAKKIQKKDVRMNVVPFMPSKTDGIENIIKSNLGDINIEDLSLPFTAVATNMKDGEEVHLTTGNLASAIAGSCAVPLVFTAVKRGDMLLEDGGVLNNVPADVPKLMGCDYVVAVDLDATRGSGTESDKMFDLVMASISIMIKSNSIRGKVHADVLISPNIKRFKSSKLNSTNDMYDEGYNDVMKQKKELLQLFAKAGKIKNRRIK